MGFRRMAQRSFFFAVEGDENWLIIFFEKNLTPSPKIIFFSFLFLYYELTRQDGSLTEENVQKKVETVVLQLLKFKITAGFVKADKLKSGIHTNVYVSHSGKKWFTFQSSVKVASIFFHVILSFFWRVGSTISYPFFDQRGKCELISSQKIIP